MSVACVLICQFSARETFSYDFCMLVSQLWCISFCSFMNLRLLRDHLITDTAGCTCNVQCEYITFFCSAAADLGIDGNGRPRGCG